ncbi:hypothetical protein ACLF3G_29055 [Falsiroseomonas sp. HC035]|uniref:hypothetical protein n=1 Tax=Falsiroseomonas sp. HC035 TaxID=3390999 RepID=UPI003D313DC2
MTESEDVYREACRRTHRVLAHYLAVYSWRHEVDCIVLDRKSVEGLLGIKKISVKRRTWVKADMASWFPYYETMDFQKTNAKLALMILSRFPVPSMLGAMTTSQRVDKLNQDGRRTRLFVLPTVPKEKFGERQMLTAMNLLAAGLIPLDDLPGT